MVKRKPKLPPRRIPAAGLIVGGRLRGWSFTFERFIPRPEGVVLVLRVTPPAWPFFRAIEMRQDYFKSLSQQPGTAHREWRWVNVSRDIAMAYELAGMPMPEGADQPEWATT